MYLGAEYRRGPLAPGCRPEDGRLGGARARSFHGRSQGTGRIGRR